VSFVVISSLLPGVAPYAFGLNAAHTSGLVSRRRDLPRQNGGGYEIQADLAHLFTEAGHLAVSDSQGGFRGDIADCRTGSACRQYQAAVFTVDELDQRLLNECSFIWDKPHDRLPGSGNRLLEPLLK